MGSELSSFEELRAASEARLGIVHVDGISWAAAPLPRRWHRCRVQTSGSFAGRKVERCACGATRLDGRAWFDRNSRRNG